MQMPPSIVRPGRAFISNTQEHQELFLSRGLASIQKKIRLLCTSGLKAACWEGPAMFFFCPRTTRPGKFSGTLWLGGPRVVASAIPKAPERKLLIDRINGN